MLITGIVVFKCLHFPMIASVKYSGSPYHPWRSENVDRCGMFDFVVRRKADASNSDSDDIRFAITLMTNEIADDSPYIFDGVGQSADKVVYS